MHPMTSSPTVAQLPPTTSGAPQRVAWREPVLGWFLSRAICIVAMVLGSQLFPIEHTYNLTSRETPSAGPKADLEQFYRDYAVGFRNLEKFGKQPMLYVTTDGPARPFVHWDVLWWLSVAEVGYVADAQLAAEQNLAFYPLFPLLIRGLHQLGIPLVLSAMLLVNGLMLLGSCLLYRFVYRRSGLAAARWTLALWLTFPTAFFSAVPYSEALLAVLSIMAMQLLLERDYISTGLSGGLASAIKIRGVLIGGALLIPFLTGPTRLRALLGMLCSGLGLLLYMVFLYHEFGDPFLFASIEKIWRPELGNPNPLAWIMDLVDATRYSLHVMSSPEAEPYRFYSGRLLAPWLTWWAILWVPAVRKLHWGLVLSSGLMILLPLSTGMNATMGRYVWVIVPIFVVMGEQLSQSTIRWLILVASTGGLLWQAFLFGGGWEMI